MNLCTAILLWTVAVVFVLLYVFDGDETDSPVQSHTPLHNDRKTSSVRGFETSSTTCRSVLGTAWPTVQAASTCKTEQDELLGELKDGLFDERGIIRTLDLVFSSDGSEKTGLTAADRPLFLVTVGNTFDSLWGRYPFLGRGFREGESGYHGEDRLIFIEGNNKTAEDMLRRRHTSLSGDDERVVVHHVAPWKDDLPAVTVRYANGPKDGRPVTVDVAAGAKPLSEDEGRILPAARLDTLLPMSSVPWVDVMMIGDAWGQEPAIISGARQVLARTRLLFFACYPGKWSSTDLDDTLSILESAGLTVVMTGHTRHLVLGKGARPDAAALAGLGTGRAMCMGVHTASKQFLLSSDAGFMLELLLAGRRAILRSDTADGLTTGVYDSPCVGYVAGQIEKGCGKVSQ